MLSRKELRNWSESSLRSTCSSVPTQFYMWNTVHLLLPLLTLLFLKSLFIPSASLFNDLLYYLLLLLLWWWWWWWCIHACRGQRMACRRQFSSTLWVLTKLWLSDLEASVLTFNRPCADLSSSLESINAWAGNIIIKTSKLIISYALSK